MMRTDEQLAADWELFIGPQKAEDYGLSFTLDEMKRIPDAQGLAADLEEVLRQRREISEQMEQMGRNAGETLASLARQILEES